MTDVDVVLPCLNEAAALPGVLAAMPFACTPGSSNPVANRVAMAKVQA